jgi:vacuolar-type H+-ATPase subunit C/Vma6
MLILSVGSIALIGGTAVLGSAAAVYGARRIIQMGQFSYHNARLSTVGNPYVTKEDVMPLMDSGSPEALSRSLTGPINVSNDVSTFQEADSDLIRGFHDEIGSLLTGSPEIVKPLIKAFIRKYESEEVKRLLRYVGGRDEPLYPVGSIDHDLEVALLTSADIEGALENLENHPMGVYLKKRLPPDDHRLRTIDTLLDGYMIDGFTDLEGMPSYCRKGVNAVRDLIRDRYNIGVILQSKALGTDREETMNMIRGNGGTIGIQTIREMVDSAGIDEALAVISGTHLDRYLKGAAGKNVTRLEIALDRMLLNGSVGLSTTYFTNVGPTIRYMIGKEMELKNLRVAFRAVFSGWDKERTWDFLVLQEEF